MISKNQYRSEKQVFQKLLLGARMYEIRYGETFYLMFSLRSDENCPSKPEIMSLLIDAPCWVGDRCQWEALMKENNGMISMQDTELASALVNLRYYNLISVQEVEFGEHYLCIFLDGEKVLAIAHEADMSDYSWILEEWSDKKPHEKVGGSCDGIEIFSNLCDSSSLLTNPHFVRWFLMMNFPEGMDAAEGCSLFELMEEKCTLDTAFIDHLTGYYDGVFEENDGYIDSPKRVVLPLATGDEFCVAFHPGDTIYFINGIKIGCTGPHYEIRRLPLSEFLVYTAQMQDKEKLFLLPMVKISAGEREVMTQIIQSVLCSFPLQECSAKQIGACILENCLE